MKIVCRACDGAMKREGVSAATPGGWEIAYSCASCGTKIALVANPGEADLARAQGLDLDAEALRWTDGARSRLARVPDAVRPLAKRAIESMARERGIRQIDESLMDEARERYL